MTDPDVLAILALELQMTKARNEKLKGILRAILGDAAVTADPGKRVWPIRATNFRRGTNALAGEGDKDGTD